MYVNKCIKCGAEFETKNPKRVICPNCLYAEKSAAPSGTGEDSTQPMQSYSSYSSYSPDERPQRRYDNRNNQRPRNNYGNNNRGRYDNNRSQGGGYGQRRFDNNRNQGGGFGGGRPQQNRRPNNRFQQNRKPNRPQKRAAKPLLVSKEQLEQIELLYKAMLPLPNPDAHEVIAEKLELESRKVFFGINLVRQKLMLPKLPFPKRKLAVTPDQMLAVKSLYEPLLPLPPIGCHKIIAAQLRIDEWRVHVAIKLIRAQLGLDRWNEERTDKPADYLEPKHPQKGKKAEKEAAKEEVKEVEEQPVEEVVEEKPKKRATRKKAVEEEPAAAEEVVEEKPKRGRKPKKKEDE